MRIVRSRNEELETLKFVPDLQSSFAACTYAIIGYIKTNMIAEAIFEQFSIEDSQKYEQKNTWMYDIHHKLTINLQLFNEQNETELKGKSFQMQLTSYKFEIKDVEKAPFIGYKLEKVASLNKDCEFCYNHDHFAVECSEYQDKSERDKLRLLLENSFCKSCILTTPHRAIDCDITLSCGFRIDKFIRCWGKLIKKKKNPSNRD